MSALLIRTLVEQRPDTDERCLKTKVFVDNRPLVDYQGATLATSMSELRRSLKNDGEFFIITCTCGEPFCAGIRRGIQVHRDSKNVHWIVRDFGPTQTYTFELEAYLAAIEQGIGQFRQMMTHHGLPVIPQGNAYLFEQEN